MNTEQKHFIKEILVLLKFYNLEQRLALLIACQFALESDYGTSVLAKANNNYCGMKVPHKRLSTAINYKSNEKWARYTSKWTCVHDFILWLMYNNVKNTENYFEKLKSYCPEKDYIKKILKIEENYVN